MELTDRQKKGSLLRIEACRVVCCRCKKDIPLHEEFAFFSVSDLDHWLGDIEEYLTLCDDGLLCDDCANPYQQDKQALEFERAHREGKAALDGVLACGGSNEEAIAAYNAAYGRVVDENEEE